MITAPQLVYLFFDHWYCENGLPLKIISDRDKPFLSQFLKALHTQTGIKLKMSTAYQLETDGSSKQMNKTVVQALHFYIARNQQGWVRALPRVRFDLMNTVNKSTGFSPFQLLLGCSPWILPPLLLQQTTSDDEEKAESIIHHIHEDVCQAKDNLIVAKIAQAVQANKSHSDNPHFKVGDFVMLSTTNHHREYHQHSDGRTAKLMPHFDSKYNE